MLDQAGGLVAFAQYIAEDYFMSKAIADRLVFGQSISREIHLCSVQIIQSLAMDISVIGCDVPV